MQSFFVFCAQPSTFLLLLVNQLIFLQNRTVAARRELVVPPVPSLAMIDLDQFWIQNSAELHGFVRSRSADQSAVEDILHDTYVKAKANIHRLREPGKMRGWVYQICRATIANYYRVRSRVKLSLSDDLLYAIDKKEGGVWRVISEAIDCKIHHLPTLYQGAVRLYALENLSEKEVAQKLNLSLPATKARIGRGRTKLRQLFENCCAFDFGASASPIVVWSEFESNIAKRDVFSSWVSHFHCD